MEKFAIFVITLSISKYFYVNGENVHVTNTFRHDERHEDIDFNNSVDTYDTDGQVKASAGDVSDFKIGRYRRSTSNSSDDDFYKPLLDFMKNVGADEPIQDEYCNCKASKDKVIQVCINSFRVPLEYIEPRKFHFGNATFKIGEMVHISCADTPVGFSSLRVSEIDPTTGKTKIVSPTVGYQFISDTYVKLQKNISYKVECSTLKKYADGSLQKLLNRATLVLLEPGVSYMNPPQDLDVNFIVNGIILSPLCSILSMNQVVNFRYFTYPGEQLTVGIAESKQLAATVAACDFHSLEGWASISNKRTARRILFEMTSDKYTTLQCGISILETNLNKSRSVEMILRFENYRPTDPYVFGLSWSRILVQFKIFTEYYMNYELYNNNEMLRLAWVSNNSETQLYNSLNYTYLGGGKKLFYFLPARAENLVKLDETTTEDTYLVKKNTKRYSEIVDIYYQKFSLGGFPTEVNINIANNESRCFLSYSRKGFLNGDMEEGIPLSTRLFLDRFNRTSFFISPELVADAETQNYSKVILIVITACIVSFVYVLISIGVCLVYRCLRVAVQAEPSVIYHCNSHHYETIPCDLSTRPPCALPSEALEENRPYIHYDTPYEWRIFRFGRRQPTQNNRRSVVK